MIENDFSNIHLTNKERRLLWYMRYFRKYYTRQKLKDSCDDLLQAEFIREIPSNRLDGFNHPIGTGKYSITDRYIRYCLYRRDQFLSGSVWPAILSGLVSLLVSFLIAKYVTQRSIEQEVARQLAEALTNLR